MREISLEKTELKLKVGGEEHILTFPTVFERKGLAEKIEKSEGDLDKIMVIQDFLEEKGLPKSVSNEFELHHLQQVIEEFNRSPK